MRIMHNVHIFYQRQYACQDIPWGRPLPNRYISCTTNAYKLDAYAGARGFDSELRQYASNVRKSLRIDDGGL